MLQWNGYDIFNNPEKYELVSKTNEDNHIKDMYKREREREETRISRIQKALVAGSINL